ncbi:MAG TPA: hypothetical protein H9895_10210 [Candidatus Pseudogracilibacillus intestinigallinarum]|uniref:Uncharacterized protein n=1 Tax=Candidatus Pseudogracilibacillus intestinigallinarum TaxID=2838742 RepID=A0A9D1PNS5_9BACI|nr:hypothetical protein [Candidatus Pseudogracilibacillus intestinigallinarum]
MSEELKESQAKQLQQLFQEVNSEHEKETKPIEKQDLVEIDVLSLPPRSEVHLSTKRKLKISLKRPLGRFLFVLFILILILGGMYIYFGEEIIYFFTH